MPSERLGAGCSEEQPLVPCDPQQLRDVAAHLRSDRAAVVVCRDERATEELAGRVEAERGGDGHGCSLLRQRARPVGQRSQISAPWLARAYYAVTAAPSQLSA